VEAATMGDSGTIPDDYREAYFASYAGGDYHEEAEHWSQFFGLVAGRIVDLFEPRTVLDAGCAKGLLVHAFIDRGVDAHGIDISDHAIGAASPAVEGRVAVGSLTDPIEGRYDLITCIEVLEHMSPDDEARAIDNLTAATDRIIFSSTPGHFDDPTHINVRQPADWAVRFAERGFFRRFDVDLRFLSPWAVAFERRAMTARDAVFAYESTLWPLREEVGEKRQALLDKERLLGVESAKAAGFDELAAEAERRQVVIDELAAEAERRQVVIDELAAEADHRQEVIDEVAAEAAHRQDVINDLWVEAERREQVVVELEDALEREHLALQAAERWKKWLPSRSRDRS